MIIKAISEDIFLYILNEWLEIEEIKCLDVAIMNRELRRWYVRLSNKMINEPLHISFRDSGHLFSLRKIANWSLGRNCAVKEMEIICNHVLFNEIWKQEEARILFQQIQGLQSLGISEKTLDTTKMDIIPLYSLLKTIPTLKQLYLRELTSSISFEAEEDSKQPQQYSIEEFILSKKQNILSNSEEQALFACIECCVKLKKMILSANITLPTLHKIFITPPHLQEFHFLKGQSTTPRILHSQQIYRMIEEFSRQSQSQPPRCLTALHTIEIEYSTYDMPYIMYLLSQCPNLTNLTLLCEAHGGDGKRDAMKWGTVLRSFASLLQFRIEGMGEEIFFEHLISSSSSNHLVSSSLPSLSLFPHTLLSLTIKQTNITDRSLATLAVHCTSLQALSLSNNPLLTNKGLYALCSSSTKAGSLSLPVTLSSFEWESDEHCPTDVNLGIQRVLHTYPHLSTIILDFYRQETSSLLSLWRYLLYDYPFAHQVESLFLSGNPEHPVHYDGVTLQQVYDLYDDRFFTWRFMNIISLKVFEVPMTQAVIDEILGTSMKLSKWFLAIQVPNPPTDEDGDSVGGLPFAQYCITRVI